MYVGRSFHLFCKSRNLKKLTRSIVSVLPSLREVASLITLFVLLFVVCGFTLCYDLLTLHITSNFPNIIMESYFHRQYVAIYFFMYNVFGIYFLMTLVLAVVYNNYNQYIVRTVRKIKRTKEEAIDRAFGALVYHQNHSRTARDTPENKMQSSMRNVFGNSIVNGGIANASIMSIGIELRRAATHALEQEQESKNKSKQSSRSNLLDSKDIVSHSTGNISISGKTAAGGTDSGNKPNSNVTSNVQGGVGVPVLKGQRKAKSLLVLGGDEKETENGRSSVSDRGSNDNINSTNGSRNANTRKSKQKKKKSQCCAVIYFYAFYEVMRRMRLDLKQEQKVQIKNIYLAITDGRRGDYDNGITRKQFRDIDHFIEMEISKDVARSKFKLYSVLMKSQYVESRLLSLGRTANGSDQVKGSNNITDVNTNTSKRKLDSNDSNKSKTRGNGTQNNNNNSKNNNSKSNNKKSKSSRHKRADAGLNNMSELLTMDFGQLGGGNISSHEPDTSGKYSTKMRIMYSFQQSLDDADLLFIESCKCLCDCCVWNRICVIESLKKYWYKLRLLLITFWEWNTKIVICEDNIACRLSVKRRNFDATMHERESTIGRDNIVFTPRFSDAKIDSFSTNSFDHAQELLCSRFNISTDTFINVFVGY